ncbi:helix-turn-helix domain-containing protein [Candidatus Enterococcus mansonii]|nr:helix-turn-helix domain-containing protein [Enterococcus sp. 4G2_DIV0659]
MEYTKILDFESKKLLELFTLLKSTNKECSLEKLSKELAVHPKTILRYLKKLQRLFKRYYLNNQLTIRTRMGSKIYLERENDLCIENFRTYYLNSLPEIIFLKSIIEGTEFETHAFIKEIQISDSSLRRRVKKVSSWLNDIGLQVKRGSHELVGEEMQVRAFVYDFYWFVYQGTATSFLCQQKKKINRIVARLIHFFQIQINDLQKESFSLFIEIAVWRYKKRNTIKLKEDWHQYLKNSSLYSQFVETMKDTEVLEVLSLDELSYLYLLIQAKFLPYFSLNLQIYLIQEHYLKKTTCYKNTLIVTNKFKQVFWEKEFDYSKETIVAFLGFHLYYELFSGSYFERIQSIEFLKKKYPRFTAKFEVGVNELVEKNLTHQLIPKEIVFYRFFTIMSSLISPVYNEKKIFICVMTDFTIEKEKELGQRIISFFQNKRNIAVVYARTTASISYADIILTTVFYQMLSQKSAQIVILIEPYFSDDIFFQIENNIKSAGL